MQHIYQRGKDHGVIFYTTEDRLVYYTLAAVNAKKYSIIVPAASIMFTHLHQSVIAASLENIRAYLHDTGTSFTRLYNNRYKRKGKLFERLPGRAQKFGAKDKRSNLIYVYNNHVEKGLCRQASEERWSFLAYAASDHPFSKPIMLSKASSSIRKALHLIDRRIAKQKGLEYTDLDKVTASLTEEEIEQFIDYVISRYALIDFGYATAFFGTLDNMILAINSTTGGEYEINEDYTRYKDTAYIELCKMLTDKEIATRCGLPSADIGRIYNLSDEELSDILSHTSRYCRSVTRDHIHRFFHRWD